MIINGTNLAALYVAFSSAFNRVLGQAPSQHKLVATRVPSTTGSNEYGWLGRFPNMREWLGDRVIHRAAAHGYAIRNKDFELTVSVQRNDVEDDNVGIYTPFFEELGRAAGAHPDQLVFGALANGHASLCYDGQNFFDTDHVVLNANGQPTTQSNLDDNSGTGTRWYLLDCSRALKPVILQVRKDAQFVAKDKPTDDNVFHQKEFVYGVDGRWNVGYGFWQLAYCSRKAPTEENLIAAYTEMTTRVGDHGRPLGIKPSILVCSPAQEIAFRKLLNASTMANGADNVMKGLVQVESSSWLT